MSWRSAPPARRRSPRRPPVLPEGEAADSGFWISEITDVIFERIQGNSFKDDCTLPREDLRYLHVLHVDLNGETHEGEMIVNYHIAEDVLDILRQLYEAKNPYTKVVDGVRIIEQDRP